MDALPAEVGLIQFSIDQLISQDTQGPAISLYCITLELIHLWRNIAGRATQLIEGP